MKIRRTMMGKRHKQGIACLMAAVLLLAAHPVAEAAEPAADGEIAAESTEKVPAYEEGIEEDVLEEVDAAQESVIQKREQQEPEKKEEADLEETVSDNSVSENTISENSVSENNTENVAEEDTSTEDGTAAEEDALTEDEDEESVSENTPEESVSENTPEESVSENTPEESVSGNTPEESVSGNTPEESVSENTAEESVSSNTMSVDNDAPALTAEGTVPPTAPTIKSIVPKDTTAQICFTHLLEDAQAAQIQYEVLVRDEVKGVDLPIQQGKEDGVLTIVGYDGNLLNTFRIAGLAANKKYSVVLRAKYGDGGQPVSSVKKIFTTKKDMIATDGSLKVHYADLEQLKNDHVRPMEVQKTGVEMRTGESCALYAQVSRLMRAVETDKLRWTVTPLGEESPKNGLKVQASKSTYEAVLTAAASGSYQVTAVNTLSKETVSTFQVTVK
ncbi:MAG: hypothetical protein OSJ72_08085 [Lachnospiraceae bacterium]|nr:hypothetical protein [Lachnospiraceae bacterium]